MAKNLIPAIHGVSSSLPTPARSPTLLLREASMRPYLPRPRGFTIIELIIVLFILSILSVFAVRSFSSRQRPAVQALLDELEGTINDALKAQDLSQTNIQFASVGNWQAGTLEVEAVLSSAGNQLVTQKFIANGHPNGAYIAIDPTPDGKMVQIALGAARQPLANVAPCNSDPWLTALGNNFCLDTGSVGTGNPTTSFPPATGKNIQLNAYNRQFVTNFCIPVVGLSQGKVYQGAPVGYLVVVGNRVFKFYTPGPNDAWRRL